MIGVIMRNSISESSHKISYVYCDIYKAIIHYNKIPISIYINDYNTAINQIELCESVIISGGDDFNSNDLKIAKYLYDLNIPTLGICLGMQTMAYLFNGKLSSVKNHKSNNNYVHYVYLKDDSIIYKLLNKNKILVNSRHIESIINTDLCVTGISDDNTIEIVEDLNKKFFVGLQWHPENMFEYDFDQKRILEYFIKGEYNEFK